MLSSLLEIVLGQWCILFLKDMKLKANKFISENWDFLSTEQCKTTITKVIEVIFFSKTLGIYNTHKYSFNEIEVDYGVYKRVHKYLQTFIFNNSQWLEYLIKKNISFKKITGPVISTCVAFVYEL